MPADVTETVRSRLGIPYKEAKNLTTQAKANLDLSDPLTASQEEEIIQEAVVLHGEQYQESQYHNASAMPNPNYNENTRTDDATELPDSQIAGDNPIVKTTVRKEELPDGGVRTITTTSTITKVKKQGKPKALPREPGDRACKCYCTIM
jgi:hypothetical protein